MRHLFILVAVVLLNSACGGGDADHAPNKSAVTDPGGSDQLTADALDAGTDTNTQAPMSAVDQASSGKTSSGKTKSMICAACHGTDGISPNDIWPNLAGQKRGYLIKQIEAFRSGDRTDPSMAPMVSSLSDEDIRDIATYYSELPH
jgi:cytochrome c553